LRTPVSASASFFLQDRQTDDTAGPDTLLGGFGADTCGVDDPGDVVVEVNEIQQTQGHFSPISSARSKAIRSWRP